MISKIDLQSKLGLIGETWSPRIVAELNGQHVKLVRFQGDFVWHHHDHEDEMFLVVGGRFRMDFRDGQQWVEAGQMIVVPRGVEHKPYAEAEATVLLFEPVSTVNTGSAGGDRTIASPAWV